MSDINNPGANWTSIPADIFWGEIAPCDHVVQVYENDAYFLDALAAFVIGGFEAGETSIVIATDRHLKALSSLLLKNGYEVGQLIARNLYIPVDANETLARFMINGWPDETLFAETVSALLNKAEYGKRKIRAFGEMVAILWAEGLNGATVHLEHLWNNFLAQKKFPLFCAYPKSGFTDDMGSSIYHICREHSKLISGSAQEPGHVIYKDAANRPNS